MYQSTQYLQSLETLYGQSSMGVLLFQLDEQVHWTLVWSNQTASTQLNIESLTSDPQILLELFSASKEDQPTKYIYSDYELNLIPLQDSLSSSILVHINEKSEQLKSISSSHTDSWVFPDEAHLQLKPTDSIPEQSAASMANPERLFSIEQMDKQSFYQNIVNKAGLASFLAPFNEKYLFWDRQALGFLDLPKNLFKKETHDFYSGSFELFLSFVHDSDKEKVIEAFEELWAHQWSIKSQFRIKSKDSSYQWFQLSVQVQTEFFVGYLENINEQIGFQRQLGAREKLIEQLIDGLPIGIVVKDAQSCYRFVNHQIEKDFQLSRAEIIGKTDYELFQSPAILQQVLAAKNDGVVGQLQIEEKSITLLNHTEWFMVGHLLMQVENLKGSIEVWSMGFYLNITERKLIEEELKEANQAALLAAQAKSDFLSIMSHEIRTPLNSVIGNATLLHDYHLESDVKTHITMIQQSAEHLLYLINDILDFNKLEAGKVELEHKPLDLAEQLNACMQMSESPAKHKNVTLKTDLRNSIPQWVKGDAGRLRQIVLNLVGNAIKFSENGEVYLIASSIIDDLNLDEDLVYKLTNNLSANSKCERVYFVVRDTGIGIDKESIPKLFQEFSQANAGTSRKFGGTGLGLAICKKLVEAMDGAIGIASQVNKGSDFAFAIPFEPTTSSSVEYSANSGGLSVEELASQRPLNILVAEDNQPNQFLIRAILKKFGHEVNIVNNGQEAVDAVVSSNNAQQAFDVVLMDLSMPEMDGFTASKTIRLLQTQGDLPVYKNGLPIVALTANALDEQKEDVEAAQMDGFLTKPINIDRLKEVLFELTK